LLGCCEQDVTETDFVSLFTHSKRQKERVVTEKIKPWNKTAI